MSLKEDLFNWLDTNESDSTNFAEDLWGFLEEKLGPVQEKLLNDISILRYDKRKLERRLEIVSSELRKIEQREDSKNS